MRPFGRFLFAAIACLFGSVAQSDPAVVLLANGRPMADVVIPDQDGQTIGYATDELAYHLKRMSGCDFSVVRERDFNRTNFPYHVFLGHTLAAAQSGVERPFETEEWCVKTVGNALYLLGGDRDGASICNSILTACHGTLFAVYEFLEKDCCVKWLWPGKMGEIIPRVSDLAFESVARSGREPLDQRKFFGIAERVPRTPGGFRSAEAREKFYADQHRFFVRHRFGARRRVPEGHAFTAYWQRFGKEHPEWFQLKPNGERGPLKGDYYAGDGGGCTLCVSNPDLQKQIVADWKAFMAATSKDQVPCEPYVNCSENDSPAMCTCGRCRSWDWPDPRFAQNDYWNGSGKDPLVFSGRHGRLSDVQWGEEGGDTLQMKPDVSDRYAMFYNAVLKEARQAVPDARVIGYAYANYTEGPRQTKLLPGITIDYVPRTYYPYRQCDSDMMRREWCAWVDAGASEMMYRPNLMLMGGTFPLDCGRRITSDFAYFYQHGMRYCLFDSLTGTWANQAMMLYALTRSFRDPTAGYEKALDEMCSGFGAAGREVRKYFEFVEAYSTSVTHSDFVKICKKNMTFDGVTPGGGFCRWTFIVGDFYTDAFFATGRMLLTAARQAAAGDSGVVARVEFLAKGLKDARLTRQTRLAQKAWLENRQDFAKKQAFETAFKAMNDFRATIEADNVCNFDEATRNERYQLQWPHEGWK